MWKNEFVSVNPHIFILIHDVLASKLKTNAYIINSELLGNNYHHIFSLSLSLKLMCIPLPYTKEYGSTSQ